MLYAYSMHCVARSSLLFGSNYFYKHLHIRGLPPRDWARHPLPSLASRCYSRPGPGIVIRPKRHKSRKPHVNSSGLMKKSKIQSVRSLHSIHIHTFSARVQGEHLSSFFQVAASARTRAGGRATPAANLSPAYIRACQRLILARPRQHTNLLARSGTRPQAVRSWAP